MLFGDFLGMTEPGRALIARKPGPLQLALVARMLLISFSQGVYPARFTMRITAL